MMKLRSLLSDWSRPVVGDQLVEPRVSRTLDVHSLVFLSEPLIENGDCDIRMRVVHPLECE